MLHGGHRVSVAFCYQPGDDADACDAPPCLQELPVVTHAMVPCGHAFCGECLAEWLSKKSDCPTCRCGP